MPTLRKKIDGKLFYCFASFPNETILNLQKTRLEVGRYGKIPKETKVTQENNEYFLWYRN